MELNFKYELGALVRALPQKVDGTALPLITPQEKYKVLARMYTEGIAPNSTRIECAIVYHVMAMHFSYLRKQSERVYMVKESDLEPWVDPNRKEADEETEKPGSED
jgi:hypothetical protein